MRKGLLGALYHLKAASNGKIALKMANITPQFSSEPQLGYDITS